MQIHLGVLLTLLFASVFLIGQEKKNFVLQSSMWRIKLRVYNEVNYERLGKLYENKLFVPIIRTIYVRR